MTSKIDNTKINANFPIAGQNNDSQGFRDNFGNIKVALGHARSEISDIQSKAIFKSSLTGGTANNDMDWATLYRTQLRAYSETVFDHGLKSGVVGVSYGDGTFHKITMSNNVILQFNGWPPPGQAGRLVIWLSVNNPTYRAFFPESLTYGLGNRQLDGRSLKFPAAGDYMVEIATIDGGNSLWFVDFANLGGRSSGSGDQGATGATGVGLPGYSGSRGPAGTYGGVTFEYVFKSGVSNGNPGTGFISFNNSGLTQATQMYISKNDKSTVDCTTYLRTIDDSTNPVKGSFKISNILDPLDFVIFHIGSATESTNYFIVNCSYITGASSFSNLEDIIISFTRFGNKGDTGATGARGYVGSAGLYVGIGATGATGPDGPIGETGATGPQGVPGVRGPFGPPGDIGSTGATGASGPSGYTGSQGIPGEFAGVGATGDLGYSGSIGFTGSQGIPGVAAYKGATGATGPSGATGPIGATGMQGATGIGIGYAGSQGIPGQYAALGYAGSRGFTGATGAFGATGLTGLNGSTGATGPGGATGATGLVGATGASGVGIVAEITSDNPYQGYGTPVLSYSNSVGTFDTTKNYFDVFPPTGKTMNDLKGFICSIAFLHFAGTVNSDDSIKCVWEVYPNNNSDRIRVSVQATEQRATPTANWLAFWG